MKAVDRRAFDAQPRPVRFTGLHRGRYYFKGVRWVGPTNLIGRRPMSLIQVGDDLHSWGLSCPA